MLCLLAALLAAAPMPDAARSPPRVIRVFVALADNATQGIVPVPPRLGNGDDPRNNLYWGARYGVKTFLHRGGDWRLAYAGAGDGPVLEQVVFRHRRHAVLLLAEAYRGAEIQRAVTDFLAAAAGRPSERAPVPAMPEVRSGGAADLLVYVGHDGLMDFTLAAPPQHADGRQRPAIVLACASRTYFAAPLQTAGARPLLWTTGLLAPEAYVLAAALEGWLNDETGAAIAERAAVAYDAFQHCGLAAARRLFVSGE